ncbi:UNVERIFIED_CONTAM: hypothetical protein K2H54_019891 [Gekko kuhli]
MGGHTERTGAGGAAAPLTGAGEHRTLPSAGARTTTGPGGHGITMGHGITPRPAPLPTVRTPLLSRTAAPWLLEETAAGLLDETEGSLRCLATMQRNESQTLKKILALKIEPDASFPLSKVNFTSFFTGQKDTEGSLLSLSEETALKYGKAIVSHFLEASDDKVLLLRKSVISSIDSAAAAVCRGWILTVVCF